METLTPPQVAELDKRLEPSLTAEEKAKEAEEAETIAREEAERKWETWGESEEQLEAQRRSMATVPEG